MKYPVLSEIKIKLAECGRLTGAQAAYLMAAIGRIENGEAPEKAFAETKQPTLKRGRGSRLYHRAKAARDLKLRQAFALLEGSDWARCLAMAERISCVSHHVEKNPEFRPDSPVDLLILQAIASGVKMPAEGRAIHASLFG